jgi:hypothetical protein
MASFDMMLTAPRTILFVGATSVGSVPEKCKSARSGFWDPTEYRPLLRCLESGTISINWPRGFPENSFAFSIRPRARRRPRPREAIKPYSVFDGGNGREKVLVPEWPRLRETGRFNQLKSEKA